MLISSPGSGCASSLSSQSSISATISSWSPSEGSAGSSSTESSTRLLNSKWVHQTWSDCYASSYLSTFSACPDGHWLGIDHSQHELWRLEAVLSHHQVEIRKIPSVGLGMSQHWDTVYFHHNTSCRLYLRQFNNVGVENSAIDPCCFPHSCKEEQTSS